MLRQSMLELGWVLNFFCFHIFTEWQTGQVGQEQPPPIISPVSLTRTHDFPWCFQHGCLRQPAVQYHCCVTSSSSSQEDHRHQMNISLYGVQTRRLIHTEPGFWWSCLCVTCSFLSTRPYIHVCYKLSVSPSVYQSSVISSSIKRTCTL